VIDARGDTRAATLGNILATRIVRRGPVLLWFVGLYGLATVLFGFYLAQRQR